MSHHSASRQWKPHKDWRVITAAVIMFVCMLIYILTLDESVVPGTAPGEPPAAIIAPANP